VSLDQELTATLPVPGVPLAPNGGRIPGSPDDQPSVGSAHRRSSHKLPLRLVVVGLVLIGALGFLLFKGLTGSLNYYQTVDQALSHRAVLKGENFRLEGVVMPGTIHRIPGGVSFVAGGAHDRIAVTNTGNPPQLFQPGIPVIVSGHFSGSRFVSNQIIVDHTSNYVEETTKSAKAANSAKTAKTKRR
jgi:cytochrome c-type biogenesis protein CcmE